MKRSSRRWAAVFVLCAAAYAQPPAGRDYLIRVARLLDVETGQITSPAEILVERGRLAAVGVSVSHPASAELIDPGDCTLLPGLIDAHVHLFLHPGPEDNSDYRRVGPGADDQGGSGRARRPDGGLHR